MSGMEGVLARGEAILRRLAFGSGKKGRYWGAQKHVSHERPGAAFYGWDVPLAVPERRERQVGGREWIRTNPANRKCRLAANDDKMILWGGRRSSCWSVVL